MRREVESHPDVGIVFLLAEAPDKKDQLGVVEEAAVNGDILQVCACGISDLKLCPSHYH